MTHVNPLTLAAAAAAGPCPEGDEPKWLARVRRLAVELSFLDPEVAEAIKRIEDAGKPFRGVVVSADVNERSKRANVILYTGTEQETDGLPAGHERVQTERQDTPEGADQIALVTSLIGHQVQIWKINEKLATDKNKNFRLLVRIADLGLPANGDAPATQQSRPQQERPSAPQPPARPAPTEAPRQERPLASVPDPAPVPASADKDWPEVAAPADAPGDADGTPIPVNDGKREVMSALGGDVNRALAAWRHIGDPQEGTVTRAKIAEAIEFGRSAA